MSTVPELRRHPKEEPLGKQMFLLIHSLRVLLCRVDFEFVRLTLTGESMTFKGVCQLVGIVDTILHSSLCWVRLDNEYRRNVRYALRPESGMAIDEHIVNI